ncbi:hypothetical protein FHS96_004383 [Sphingomonas zeicaulis]|uniref:DUF2271 domain-containing protein n=1 Tax=Sphingomonas zeicaulis TaxID=1632740 RepID=UPI003D23AF3D
MQIAHRIMVTGPALAAGAAGLAVPAAAQTVEIAVTIPRLTVAEYHRPYVAMWLEKQGTPAKTVSVWYDYDMRNNEGTKWLRDVRQWWRVSGRTMTFPANGVTGATRAPGVQTIAFPAARPPFGPIAPGSYTLVIEAAREVGGRELVRVPFTWPIKSGQVLRAAGTTELGAVTLKVK